MMRVLIVPSTVLIGIDSFQPLYSDWPAGALTGAVAQGVMIFVLNDGDENMEVPRHWRMKKQRYAMVGETCPDCHSPIFPPRAVCPHCEERRRTASLSLPHASLLAYQEKPQTVER